MVNLQKALEAFRSAAIEKGDLGEPTRDRDLHDSMRAAFHDLRRMGALGAAAFRGLLTDVSPHVRLWVAAELLSGGDGEARRVLERLAAETGLLGLAASTTLKEHDAGHFHSPFE